MKTLLLLFSAIILSYIMPEEETTLHVKGQPVVVIANRQSIDESPSHDTKLDTDTLTVDNTKLSGKATK